MNSGSLSGAQRRAPRFENGLRILRHVDASAANYTPWPQALLMNLASFSMVA